MDENLITTLGRALALLLEITPRIENCPHPHCGLCDNHSAVIKQATDANAAFLDWRSRPHLDWPSRPQAEKKAVEK